MATSTTDLQLCSTVDCKRDANAICLHCDEYVCTKHYLEHVKITNDEILPLADRLNSVINTLQHLDVSYLSQFAIEQLEQWRLESHQHIDKLCSEKQKTLHKIVQLKLDEEALLSKKLNDIVRQYTDHTDASFQKVEKIRKDIDALENRCSNLQRFDFFHIEATPFEFQRQSIMVKSRQFNYFLGGGSLLRLEHQILLNEWIDLKGQNWRLIYKATRDGFKAEDFHRCADNQGCTFTIVQEKENGYLFGGYTSQEWSSTKQYVEDKHNPFLFTLTNPHNIPPTRYAINSTDVKYAVGHNPTYGPTFGAGFDLYVCNESDFMIGSYFKFPRSYIDTTGKGSLTFTGNNQFHTSDIEVYRLT